MKLRTKVLSMLMTLALVIGLATPVQAKAETTGFTLEDIAGKTVILHTNDTHGRVDMGTDSSLGITAVAALRRACKAAGAEVILLDAGDTLHGKPIATIDQGETIVDLMNAVGYDAMTLGNHDYNYGSAHVKELEKEMNFPMLAANVTVKEDGSLFVENHTIIEKNGVKYGVFGLSTEETATKTNPKNVETLTFKDPVATAKAEVKALKDEGADVIVALGHIGIDASSDPTSVDVIEQVEGIDLFIDGHSHSSLASCIETNDTDTLLVSNGQYLQTIGCVVVDSDMSLTPYSITKDDLKKVNIRVDLLDGETPAIVDQPVGEILVAANEKLGESLKEVVGSTAIYLDGVREHVRTSETNLGNLAADAIRWAAGTDVAMTNGGGIRTAIEIGDITKGMLAEVFPFGNIVVSKEVTGQAIKDMLEHGVKDYPATSGGYPQTSGMTYTIDANKAAGNRISNIKVNGVAIDMEATYTLASNDFTIAGGDGYTMIGDDVFPTLYEFGALDEVLISYLETKPAVDSFAVGRTTLIPLGETAADEDATEETTEETAKDPVIDDTKEEVPDVSDETVAVTYTVKKGDFLRKIAKELLGSESAWKQIFELNKDLISDPNMLTIGWELVIE